MSAQLKFRCEYVVFVASEVNCPGRYPDVGIRESHAIKHSIKHTITKRTLELFTVLKNVHLNSRRANQLRSLVSMYIEEIDSPGRGYTLHRVA